VGALVVVMGVPFIGLGLRDAGRTVVVLPLVEATAKGNSVGAAVAGESQKPLGSTVGVAVVGALALAGGGDFIERADTRRFMGDYEVSVVAALQLEPMWVH
jgi:hypothetical protein